MTENGTDRTINHKQAILDKEILTYIGLLQKHFLDDFLIIFSFLYLNTTLDKLQPSTQILGTEYTIGWATGLKACSEPGKC